MPGRCLIVGGSIQSVQTALDIADSGLEVTLIEKYSLLRTDSAEDALFDRPKLLRARSHPRIELLTETEVIEIEGEKGAYRVKAVRYPRYIDTEACTSCGRCEHECPVVLLTQSGKGARKAVHRPDDGLKSVPSTCVIDKTGVAPCTAACPAGINVQGYVALISKGKLREALDLIREAVPFPHILGRVCTHPCENACTRGQLDQPIAIASLKRYLADMEPSQYTLIPTEVVDPDSPKRVAIIGSGPSGLTCARDLVRLGHNSTVFEALPKPGGMVAVGMPRFRLPHEVREAEINAITNLGIEIKTNTALGKDVTLDDLKAQGYEAVFIASGAHKNQTLDIPGEDLEGVIDSIDLLRSVNLKLPVEIGQNVVVIGGGYTAIDSARTAIRLNRNKSRIVYRRTADEMTATKAEILETIEEGVTMTFLATPIRILGEDGKVVGIECQEMVLGEPDASGRRRPVPVEGSTFTIDCDTVVTAIGQLPDLEIFSQGDVCLENNGRTLVVDPLTLSTNVPWIFAGGDVVSGPRSMVEAVGDGRRAAVSIGRLLSGEDLREGRTIEKPIPVEVNLDEVKIVHRGRRRIPVLPVQDRIGNFEEVERGYNTFMALREAKRCLACGGCSECMECVRQCELGAVHHDMQPEELLLEVGAIVVAGNDEKGVFSETVYSLDENIKPARASAVATKVMLDLADYRKEVVPGTVHDVGISKGDIGQPKVGVFVCRCGGNISDVVDLPRLINHLYRRHKGVHYAQEINYSCSDEGSSEIKEAVKELGLTHVVVAACACCALDQICFSCADRRIECKDKLLGQGEAEGLCYEFINIREHCAWVHSNDPEKAFEKARNLTRGAISRLQETSSAEVPIIRIKQSVAIIGGSLAAFQAAVELLSMGIQTTVLIPGKQGLDQYSQLLNQIEQKGGKWFVGVHLNAVEGSIGDFVIEGEHHGRKLNLNVGAIVVDRSKMSKKQLPALIEVAVERNEGGAGQSEMPGIFVYEKKSVKIGDEPDFDQVSAIVSKISALLASGEVRAVQTLAVVDPIVCRGCGICAEVCQFRAASLIEAGSGIFISRINGAVCRGCGTCVAHCPSSAITQNGLSDSQITSAMEAMLVIS